MRKFLALLVILLGFALYGWYSDFTKENQPHRELVLYSDLPAKFITALTEGFSQEHNIGLKIMKLDTLDGSKQHADLVLTSRMVLNQLSRAGAFETLYLPALEHLPAGYKDGQNFWAGLLYDSLVVLVNKEYARKFGQVHLTGWQDLLNASKARVVVEHFDNSDLQRQILGAFASRMGEEHCLDYFAALEDRVVQHSRFSFTPVRVIMEGRADLAITLRSYVYEFAGVDFPAYILEPREGTPAVIYGVAIYKGSDSLQEAKVLAQWLLSSHRVRQIALKEETGFGFLMPKGIPGPVVDGSTFWFNEKYLDQDKLADLLQQWYEKVLFKGLF